MFLASTATELETAISGGFSDMTSLVTGTLIPLLMGLVILGIGVGIGVKWLRKGASQT